MKQLFDARVEKNKDRRVTRDFPCQIHPATCVPARRVGQCYSVNCISLSPQINILASIPLKRWMLQRQMYTAGLREQGFITNFTTARRCRLQFN